MMALVAAIFVMLLAGILIYIFFSGPKLPPETDTIIERVFDSDLPELVVGQTGFAASNGLNIWYESMAPEGSAKGVVLLIIGSGANALDWPPKFVRAFLDAGYQTVRYDNRGTGLSDRVESWDRNNPYSIVDMAGDAAAVLDALKIQKAHLVGLSMGGMIAQEIAINHPDKVASLTLMLTSGYIGDPDIPGLSSRYFLTSLLKGLPLFKYRLLGGEKNLIKERIAKILTAPGYVDLDIKEVAELVLYDLRKRKGVSIKGVLQHQAAVTISGSRYEKLKTLNVPTLVIHGTADQLIPVEHGKKLVEVIPHARGLWLDGVGHTFPLPDMDEIHKSIVSNFSQ